MATLCPVFQTTPVAQYEDENTPEENKDDAVQDCVSPLYDSICRRTSPRTQERWRIAAIICSYISILVTITLVIVNLIVAGISDSAAAFGAGIDTLLSIISSLVIVWRYSEQRLQPAEKIPSTDRKASITVITLFLFGSLTIFIVATKCLLEQSVIHSSESVMIIFTVATVCYILLYFIKAIISGRLYSKAMAIDAVDSLAAGATSLAVICGAVVVKYFPKAWFVDESIALCIAVVMAIYGSRMLYEIFVPTNYVVGLLSDQDRD